MCWVVELMNMFCHRNIRHWRDYWVYDHEKVKFRRLVACYWTFSWTVKGPSTQTKQNKKIIISAPSGYKPTSRFSCLGSGADVSLVTLSFNGNERKTCRGIRKSWPPTLTCPVLRLSPTHWLRESKRFCFLEKMCPFNLSSDNHENDNVLTLLNTRNQIYLLDRYRDQTNATVK